MGRMPVHDSAVRARVEREVCEWLEASGIGSRDRVALGCSGGIDSTALACAVGTLVAAGCLAGATLIHVDHGLRPDSPRGGRWVARLAARLGLEFRLAHVEVARRASIEDAAREARYEALERIARELGDVFVLLAHTASDQAETVLMRAVRGTGVAGLAGIPARRGRYLRPLLRLGRAELERYLRERGEPALEDPSNDDMGIARNRFRRRWLPELRAENPRLEEALSRLAESAKDQREVLDYAAELLRERARHAAARPERLAVAPLAAAPRAVTSRALAREAERILGKPLSSPHVRALVELARRPAAGSVEISLPGGRGVREYGDLWLESGAGGRELPGDIFIEGPDGPYEVRAWRAGDRMRPARLGGRSRKLSDLYIDAKVPKRIRDGARVAVRAGDGAIVWAEHLGRAHGVEIEVTLTPPEPLTSNRD